MRASTFSTIGLQLFCFLKVRFSFKRCVSDTSETSCSKWTSSSCMGCNQILLKKKKVGPIIRLSTFIVAYVINHMLNLMGDQPPRNSSRPSSSLLFFLRPRVSPTQLGQRAFGTMLEGHSILNSRGLILRGTYKPIYVRSHISFRLLIHKIWPTCLKLTKIQPCNHMRAKIFS